jgi:hypothetical protein
VLGRLAALPLVSDQVIQLELMELRRLDAFEPLFSGDEQPHRSRKRGFSGWLNTCVASPARPVLTQWRSGAASPIGL